AQRREGVSGRRSGPPRSRMTYRCAPRTPPTYTPGGRYTDMRNKMLPSSERRHWMNVLFVGIVLVLVFFHIPAEAQTPHAVKLGATQSFTLPNSGAWMEGSGRIEFRLQNVSQPSSDLYIHQLPWADCRLNANSLTLRCLDGRDSAIVTLDLTGRTDIR